MTLGTRIKIARERLKPKLTQKAIGNALGITDQAVSSWERDLTDPEPDKIPKLREILQVTYSWLFAGSGAPPDPNDPLVRLDGLSQAQRDAVSAFLGKVA